MMRTLTYVEAIREGHAQALNSDPRVFLIGQGVWSPWYGGGSLQDLDKQFPGRVLDCPVSENATTGAAVGAALAGMRPIMFHPRMDFMVLAIDPIINQAANWCYMFGGKMSVPLVIRSVINRGGEQGAQHSQALQAFFMHVPGMKIVMPATPYSAKGLLLSAIQDNNPVLYIDDRWLYQESGDVPQESYMVPIGEAKMLRGGSDVTIVATSYMVGQALKAAALLTSDGIECEVVDLQSIKPWDKQTIYRSVRKTGRVVIADAAWKTCGVAAEIAASIVGEEFSSLRAPILRVCLPDVPAPTNPIEERAYYPGSNEIATAVRQLASPASI
jgi:pyruvate dehydrogenase E1 component beta subunit